MPIGLLKDLAATCPYPARLLGVDLGTKTIGLALTNTEQTLATPLKTIARTKMAKDMAELGAVIREYEVGGVIFGWPLNMDGTRGAACDRVMSFIDEMKNYPQDLGIKPGMDLWIALWDERLSTAAVNDFLIGERDMSRQKRGEVVDSLAALHILQGAIAAF